VKSLDGYDRSIAGYSTEDLDLIRSNFFLKAIAWNRDSDISGFAGKHTKIHSLLRDARICTSEFGQKEREWLGPDP